MLQLLDRMSCGAVVVDSEGDPMDLNTTAAYILGQQELGSLGIPSPEGSRRALRSLLKQAGQALQIESETWVTVSRSTGAPLVLHTIPLAQTGSPGSRTVIILVDLRHSPRPTLNVLQKLFDLTPAEARLAIEIVSGRTLSEASTKMGLSSATLRTQLSAVFTKTQTRRQAELVALLTRVAIFP
ncbi:LuxR family transcriptional regulator [Methylobacterium sp. M6A4_1b]